MNHIFNVPEKQIVVAAGEEAKAVLQRIAISSGWADGNKCFWLGIPLTMWSGFGRLLAGDVPDV